MLRWLKILAPALALAALIFEVGCTSNDLAQVRFVHAIQDANPLDIDINGTREFVNVGFTDYLPTSGYMGVPTGNVTIEGFPTGTSTETFSTSGVKLSAASQYTMVATGFATNTSSVIILAPVDNNTTPANGTINFRVIDASPSGPTAVDIYIQQSQVQGLTPPATIAGLSYQQTSKYLSEPYNINGGGYTIYVCAAGSTTPIFFQNIPVGSSNAGSIRTLILTDQPNKDELNPQFIVLHDLN
jgi:hypothetical protein